jgi:hypothetical protein
LDQLVIARVPIGSLVPDPANPRRHDEHNLAAIRASLQRFKQAEPIVRVGSRPDPDARRSRGCCVGAAQEMIEMDAAFPDTVATPDRAAGGATRFRRP